MGASETKNCAFGGLWATQLIVLRISQDDLPSISISRLRATGVVTAEMTSVLG
jgi:hypothetical protein